MPTYQVLIYTDLEDVTDLVITDEPAAADKIRLPIYQIEPQPHPTLGHTFTLPPGLKKRLCAPQPPQ